MKIRKGYRVIEKNTTDGVSNNVWYFETLELANLFAEQLCKDSKREIEVCKYIGSWRIIEPAEFIPAEDFIEEDRKHENI